MHTIFLPSPYSDRRRLKINFCDHPGFTEQEQTFKGAISNGLRSLAEKLKSYFWGSKSMLGEPKRRFHRITKKAKKDSLNGRYGCIMLIVVFDEGVFSASFLTKN